PRGGARAPLAAAGRAVRRPWYAFVGWVARLLLRACRDHAAEMERGVAAAAAQRAQHVDYGLRIVAQEQVGLAYAGWDRLLTRVALPAWRMGRWPARLDAGVVAALTELSRRDRLAEGFASRLGERPACDLLEEPGAIDEATSLLAARLFHGGPATPSPAWSPVDWEQYPEEVVDRKWRQDAARLHAALGTLPPAHRPQPPHSTEPTAPGHATTSPAGENATASRAGPNAATPPAGEATTPSASAQPFAAAGRSHATASPAGPNPATPPVGQATTPSASAPATDATPAPPPVPQDPQPAGQPTTTTEHIPAGLTPAEPTSTRPAPADPTPPAAEAPDPAAPAPATPADPATPNPATSRPEADAPAPATPAAGAATAAPAAFGSATSRSEANAPGADAGFGPDLGVEPTLDRMFVELAVPGGADADPAAIADRLAARLTTELAREEAEQRRSAASAGAHGPAAAVPGAGAGGEPWLDGLAPLFPLQPPRTGRELLADHVTAMVCCAAMDTAGAAPGLDWLDGPTLLIDGERRTDLAPRVLSLIEDGDPEPLRAWLNDVGARPDKPIRLV
ncbi:hypothetical protein AAHZ94_14365, partial [Streptomyces sp. HSW2009]|uniref:hypothetical protein n=1 Tax=Streptomyces sp. HSW2009 TaxID=3142890 RepID=UPI0032EC7FCB